MLLGKFHCNCHKGRQRIWFKAHLQTTGIPYFYSATLYPQYIIRSALPYDVNLVNSLAADPHYLWFTAIVTLLLIFVFYKFTSKLGTAINHLREFAKRADKNEPVETDIQSAFPHNELGEISQHIIQIYKRLRETKEALYIEREKLITHLQTSREGLGVFTKDKKEILVNNLFTQYGNLSPIPTCKLPRRYFPFTNFKKSPILSVRHKENLRIKKRSVSPSTSIKTGAYSL